VSGEGKSGYFVQAHKAAGINNRGAFTPTECRSRGRRCKTSPANNQSGARQKKIAARRAPAYLFFAIRGFGVVLTAASASLLASAALIAASEFLARRSFAAADMSFGILGMIRSLLPHQSSDMAAIGLAKAPDQKS
jgi:hypothetical protein